MFDITTGVVKAPAKVLLYGGPGIGKSYFCAQIKDVIFCDAERGTNTIDCARVQVKDASELFKFVTFIAQNEKYKTVVFDSFTKIEKMLVEAILKANSWPNLEKPGYGKGYEVLRQDIMRFVNAIDYLIDNKKNVFVIGHARVKLFSDPMHDSYDRYEPDIHKSALSQFISQMDAVLFLKYKTVIRETESGKNQARGNGDRELYAAERLSFLAKNRYSLPDVVTNPKPEEYLKNVIL